jgi:DNA replication protein DnaC
MSAEATSYQRLREHLAYLKLSTAADHLSAELDRALDEKRSALVLETLLEAEVLETRARRQRGRLRFARYPVIKTLADFDFEFQPSLDRKLIAELSTLRFVEQRRSIVFLGPPGVGKTHLAVALGVEVSQVVATAIVDRLGTLKPARAPPSRAGVPLARTWWRTSESRAGGRFGAPFAGS